MDLWIFFNHSGELLFCLVIYFTRLGVNLSLFSVEKEYKLSCRKEVGVEMDMLLFYQPPLQHCNTIKQDKGFINQSKYEIMLLKGSVICFTESFIIVEY